MKKKSVIFRRQLLRWAVMLVFFFLPNYSCLLYNDFNLSGDYRLDGGFYYDGINYPLEDYQGTMKLDGTSYRVSYTLSFYKKDGGEVIETREEKGSYGYTSESERTVYGTNEKFWSGIIFFYPDTGEGYRMKYEYLVKSRRLMLDNTYQYDEKGYYVEFEWQDR